MEKITYFGNEIVKESNWDHCKNYSFDEKEYSYDQFSWPPRHYTCTFCRRKFQSAQALGGHMNVHRRDRAMLRQQPSWILQFPHPSPDPSSSSPNLGFKHSTVSCSSPSTSLSHLTNNTIPPPYKPKSLTMPPFLSKRSMLGIRSKGFEDFGEGDDDFTVVENGKIGRLDLELGLDRNGEQDLDLELRLGCS